MLTVTSAQLLEWVATFVLPLVRILALLSVMPVLGVPVVPARVKVGLGVLITLIVTPTLPPVPAAVLDTWFGLGLIAKEIMIGLAMGFATRIAFAAIDFAAELISLQMGLGFATFFDPQTADQTSGVGRFLNVMATLVFLALNAHLMIIGALAESFRVMPLDGAVFSGGAAHGMVEAGGAIFSFGLALALPVVGALLVTNLALGILTRAAPQLHLFAVGFPISLAVGFLLLAMTVPYLTPIFERMFQHGLELAVRVTG
jgi:flagellar biosynthesis protein FliR